MRETTPSDSQRTHTHRHALSPQLSRTASVDNERSTYHLLLVQYLSVVHRVGTRCDQSLVLQTLPFELEIFVLKQHASATAHKLDRGMQRCHCFDPKPGEFVSPCLVSDNTVRLAMVSNNQSGPTAAALKPQNTGDSIRSERSFHSSHGHQTPVLSRKSSIANTKINTAQIGVPLPKDGGEPEGFQARPRMHKRSLTGERSRAGHPLGCLVGDGRVRADRGHERRVAVNRPL